MTTIAYKDGVIAYDSQITRGNVILYDDFDKCIVRDGRMFVCSGATADFDALISAYSGSKPTEKIDAIALVIDGDRVNHFAVCETDGPWRAEVLLSHPYAIGSGQEYALAAMDAGLSAYDAVRIAAKRDTSTGGKIRTIRLGFYPSGKDA